jgi:predicted unusual protein kinase regulating ubiquinone biosynthesis (AarF/ABC1/UbiB family)
VKVQRQGLKPLFDEDLQNLKVLVRLLDAVDPKADGADRNWVRIYEEVRKTEQSFEYRMIRRTAD